ncbi:hypothetical protein BMR05_15020 [Methylococcaceae bacterium HT4]|nr:hypothetical protein BMR05_15020 [Methylococcaceae bacterium HT4]TXL14352.1 hypothetical protein BMR04_13385 [Methylococcaceae bacterium HT3]TXL17945.1 hypothetical protein BMR06_14350 [Methylococcaceae bacterium HT5]TXL20560.1 hypothetical protein BMR03_14290 [Methylococcaceae bacterium HT2]
MNWCISSQLNTYLIIHAAVIEKSGYAVIMPAPPGSGKSTLTASLIQEGWRLLSDELTIIDVQNACVVPFPRPVSLKNESIDIIILMLFLGLFLQIRLREMSVTLNPHF